MLHDFTVKQNEQTQMFDVITRSPKVTKPLIRIMPKLSDSVRRRLDLKPTSQENSPFVINVFNNQLYEQTVTAAARLVNNHHQNIHFQRTPPGTQVLNEL